MYFFTFDDLALSHFYFFKGQNFGRFFWLVRVQTSNCFWPNLFTTCCWPTSLLFLRNKRRRKEKKKEFVLQQKELLIKPKKKTGKEVEIKEWTFCCPGGDRLLFFLSAHVMMWPLMNRCQFQQHFTRSFFCTKEFWWPFLCLQFVFVIFLAIGKWRKSCL